MAEGPRRPGLTRRLLVRVALPLAALATVFAVKLAVLSQLWDHPLLQPEAGLDTTVYVQLAADVLSGNLALGPGLYYVSPLYVYFLAAILKLASGSLLWVRFVQIGLGTLTVWLIFETARVWYGKRAAWIAAALAAGTGLFTFYEVLILQAAIDPFLAAIALATLASALSTGRALPLVAAGAAFGIQTLNRPNVLLAAAGIVLVLVVAKRWRSGALMVAGILLALLPVTARNYSVSGDLSPASSHGGLDFYIGNNPDADGTSRMVDGVTPSIADRRDDAIRLAEEAIGRPLDDSEVSAHFYGLGWRWIREHPVAAAGLLLRKLAYTFNAAGLPLNHSYAYFAYDERTLLQLLPVGAWLLIPLGLVGLWIAQPSDPALRRSFWIWASFVPFYALAVAVFFVSSRYRVPLLVAFTVTSGGAVDAIWREIAEHEAGRARRLALTAAAILALAVVVNWPVGLDDRRSDERIRMALHLVDRERYAEAEALVSDIARDYPAPGVLHFRVGRALLAKRQTQAALEHLQRSRAAEPDRPENQYAYGQALLEAGRPAEAIPHLKSAYEAGVRVDLAGYDLARALGVTGDRAGAVRVLQGVQPKRDRDGASWYVMGQLAMQLNAPKLAEVYYRQALEAQPAAAAAHHQLGLALATMGRFQEAARSFEDAVRLEPKDATARLNYAVALAELGKTVEARVHAEEALRLRPDYPRAKEFLSVLPK